MPAQATRTPITAPVMPTMNPNGTSVESNEAEIRRRVEEEVKKLQGQSEVWEIVAPCGDPKHDYWMELHDGRWVNKYSASNAQRDGTWDLQVPAHDYYDHDTGKVTRVKAQVIPMYSGKARTADKYAAIWIKEQFNYTIRKVDE